MYFQRKTKLVENYNVQSKDMTINLCKTRSQLYIYISPGHWEKYLKNVKHVSKNTYPFILLL